MPLLAQVPKQLLAAALSLQEVLLQVQAQARGLVQVPLLMPTPRQLPAPAAALPELLVQALVGVRVPLLMPKHCQLLAVVAMLVWVLMPTLNLQLVRVLMRVQPLVHVLG